MSSTAAPLADIRILAVEQYGAGPFGSLYLADLGADIIKIEDPSSGGDIGRYIPPGQVGRSSLFFESFNRNKRSIALDLKSGAGREVFERLVAVSDAVYSNLRGDQPERLRIRYPDLAEVNPQIVCVTVTGYGTRGEQARWPGYDALIQAETGWAALTGDPDGPPTKSGLSLADYVAGLTGALALLAGVIEARRTGRGRDIDTNLYDAALAMLSYPATWYLSSGYVTERQPLSAHPSVVPFQFFATAEGYLAVACPKEKFFRALIERIGLSELADDPRFVDFEARYRHRAELLAILSARFAQKPTAEWLDVLRGHVPVAPVRSLAEALEVDDLRRRSMLAEYEHPRFGLVRSVGLPLAVEGYSPTYRPAPELNGNAAEILAELGYDASAREELAQRGAFGSVTGAPEELGVG